VIYLLLSGAGPISTLLKSHLANSLLLILGFVILLLLQNQRGLWETDEGRYTAVALQMLDSGDYLHPRLDQDTPHFSKPPLTYWSIAAAIAVFGHQEWAARLPNTLAFALTLFLVFRLGKRFIPDRPWLAPLIYATSVLPLGGASVITTDTLLTSWETLGMYGLIMTIDSTAAQRRRWRYLGWFGFGLAFFTKGPPGLLPLLGLIIYSLWSSGWGGLKPLFSWVSGLLFLVISLAWFVVVIAGNPDLLHYFFADELVNRVASNKFHRNPGWPGLYRVFLPAIILGCFPWAWLAVGQQLITYFGKQGKFVSVDRRWQRDTRLLLCWLLLPLLVFALAQSRLLLYLLPSCVPATLLIARWIKPGILKAHFARVLLGLWLVVLIAGLLMVASRVSERDDRLFASKIQALPLKDNELPGRLVFIDYPPSRGLPFYLPAKVLSVPVKALSKSHPRAYARVIRLLADRESTLWFTTDSLAGKAFLQLAAAHGYRSDKLGQYYRFNIYRLLKNSRRLSENRSRPVCCSCKTGTSAIHGGRSEGKWVRSFFQSFEARSGTGMCRLRT